MDPAPSLAYVPGFQHQDVYVLTLTYFFIPKACSQKGHCLKSAFCVKYPSLQLQFAQKMSFQLTKLTEI